MERPPKSPTPCTSCPKCDGEQEKSPEVGRQADLSEKNWRTIALYHEVQGVAGCGVVPDGITRQNFGIIHQEHESFARDQNRILLAVLAAAPR